MDQIWKSSTCSLKRWQRGPKIKRWSLLWLSIPAEIALLKVACSEVIYVRPNCQQFRRHVAPSNVINVSNFCNKIFRSFRSTGGQNPRQHSLHRQPLLLVGCHAVPPPFGTVFFHLYTLLTVSLVLGLSSRLSCSQDICSRSTVCASDILTRSFARC